MYTLGSVEVYPQSSRTANEAPQKGSAPLSSATLEPISVETNIDSYTD